MSFGRSFWPTVFRDLEHVLPVSNTPEPWLRSQPSRAPAAPAHRRHRRLTIATQPNGHTTATATTSVVNAPRGRHYHALLPHASSHPLFSPFPFGSSLFNHANALFENARVQTPVLHIHESSSEFTIEAEVPGYKRGDVEIRYVGGSQRQLTVRGTRSRPHLHHHSASPRTIKVDATDDVNTNGIKDASEDLRNDPTPEKSAQVPSSGDSASAYETLPPQPEEAAPEKSDVSEADAEVDSAKQSFEQVIQFPVAVEASQIRAKLEDGILLITVPKTKPRSPEEQHVRID